VMEIRPKRTTTTLKKTETWLPFLIEI